MQRSDQLVEQHVMVKNEHYLVRSGMYNLSLSMRILITLITPTVLLLLVLVAGYLYLRPVLEPQRDSTLIILLLSSSSLLILISILALWLTRSITRPLQVLTDVAHTVASGDLTCRADICRHDELGQLACAFDSAITTISTVIELHAHKVGELNAILQAMADGVLAIDYQERIVVVNPVAACLLEHQPPALLAQPLTNLLHYQDPLYSEGLQRIVTQLKHQLTAPSDTSATEQIVLGKRIVRLHPSPTYGRGVSVTGAVVIMQDITEAVEAERAKSAFIGTASHEMRTPLASMKGFIDLFYLSGIDNLTEDQHIFLDTIKRQTNNMINVVNDVLEIARLEQGTLRGELRWVMPLQVIEAVLISLDTQVQQRQLTTLLLMPTELPALWIDATHLSRILTNLLSNAIKYTPPGGQIQIRASLIDDPSQLPDMVHDQPWSNQSPRSILLEVEDTGVGIRITDQDRIFTRFFRSENSLSVEAGGSGLGLAITRSLVHLHGGQIGFRSQEGQGSCFWVRLPIPDTETL